MTDTAARKKPKSAAAASAVSCSQPCHQRKLAVTVQRKSFEETSVQWTLSRIQDPESTRTLVTDGANETGDEPTESGCKTETHSHFLVQISVRDQTNGHEWMRHERIGSVRNGLNEHSERWKVPAKLLTPGHEYCVCVKLLRLAGEDKDETEGVNCFNVVEEITDLFCAGLYACACHVTCFG